MDNSNYDSNFDWLVTQNRLITTEGRHNKESMKSIEIMYIYIDLSSNITNVLKEKVLLSNDAVGSNISKDKIMNTLNTKNINSGKKYNLLDTLLYNTNIESESVQSYSQHPLENDIQFFLKPMPKNSEIKIPQTLFIFHETNCIYFIYQEEALNNILKLKTHKFIIKKSTIGTRKKR